jgi:uncharacterized membrane protein
MDLSSLANEHFPRLNEIELATIQALLLHQGRQLDERQQQLSRQLDDQKQQLDGLASGFMQIAKILQQQNSTLNPALATIERDIHGLTKTISLLQQQVDKANPSRELIALTSEQQAVRQALETNRSSLNRQNQQLTTHLDWKRTALIIATAVVICSFYSVALGQVIYLSQHKSPAQVITSRDTLPVKAKK